MGDGQTWEIRRIPDYGFHVECGIGLTDPLTLYGISPSRRRESAAAGDSRPSREAPLPERRRERLFLQSVAPASRLGPTLSPASPQTRIRLPSGPSEASLVLFRLRRPRGCAPGPRLRNPTVPLYSHPVLDDAPSALVEQVQRHDVVSSELVATIPGDLIVGVLETAQGRAGARGVAIVRALLGGQPRGMSALAGRMTRKELESLCRADRELARAVDLAEQIGFSSTLETELYRRAMAGGGDRGSIRALDIVVRSRRDEYREKTQVHLTLQTAAQEAEADIGAGWTEANFRNADDDKT